MSKDWRYSQLSKLAKSFGGPEKMIAAIKKNGENVGMLKGAAIGASAMLVISEVAHYIKDSAAKSKKEAEEAEQELIDGINKYDNEHPNE